MNHYEITITPLSEEGKANGGQPVTEQVEAYVLGAIKEEGDESSTTIVHMQGTSTIWASFINLVEKLMENYPEQTNAALEVAMDHVRAGNGDKKMH